MSTVCLLVFILFLPESLFLAGLVLLPFFTQNERLFQPMKFEIFLLRRSFPDFLIKSIPYTFLALVYQIYYIRNVIKAF